MFGLRFKFFAGVGEELVLKLDNFRLEGGGVNHNNFPVVHVNMDTCEIVAPKEDVGKLTIIRP